MSVLAGNGQMLQDYVTAARLAPKHTALVWSQHQSELSSFMPISSDIQDNC